MENAAEALKMAAGMMMAILLIGLAVYLFNSISGIEDSKRDQEMQAEATEFNKRFSAFDRSSLYGTDVISVIGLAISNNRIYNQENNANPLGNYDSDSRYSINIEFQLTNNIEKVTTENKFRMIDQDGDGILEEVPDPGYPKETGKEPVLLKNNSGEFYNLEFNKTTLYSEYASYRAEIESGNNNPPMGNTYKIYAGIEKIATQGDNTITTRTRQQGVKLLRITEDTSGYGDFKSTIFKCTEVKYNDVGRIYYMKFVAKKYVNNRR